MEENSLPNWKSPQSGHNNIPTTKYTSMKFQNSSFQKAYEKYTAGGNMQIF